MLRRPGCGRKNVLFDVIVIYMFVITDTEHAAVDADEESTVFARDNDD